jgi:hypothetical protein
MEGMGGTRMRMRAHAGLCTDAGQAPSHLNVASECHDTQNGDAQDGMSRQEDLST